MSKMENKLKANKFASIDKVTRRTLKAQKSFDNSTGHINLSKPENAKENDYNE